MYRRANEHSSFQNVSASEGPVVTPRTSRLQAKGGLLHHLMGHYPEQSP